MQKYRVLVIGAGNIAANYDDPLSENILTHAHAFSISEYFELSGFYDTNVKKAEWAAQKWQCASFKTLEEALYRTDVVCCAVPDEHHFGILKKISTYPIKLVFAEKPITKTAAEAQEIIDLFREKEIKLLVNYSRRFIDQFISLKQLIEESGDLIGGTAYYGKGTLHNGSHLVDILQYLVGKIERTESFSKIYDFTQEDPTVSARLFINNGSVTINAIDSRVVSIFEMDLLFEKRRIRIADSELIIEVYDAKQSEVFFGYIEYTDRQEIKINVSSAFNNAVRNIYDIIKGTNAPMSSAQNAADVLSICLNMIRESE